MQIQSLSIAVPVQGCINKCPFCVSRMHWADYPNQIEKNKRFADLYERDYKERLLFARKNGCNTAILTGNGEALQNFQFLKNFSHWNESLGDNRFLWIELQSTGVLLDDEMLRFLRNTVRVKTIALSICDLWDSENNAKLTKMPEKYKVDIDSLCAEIKRYDFNLRLCLNLSSLYDNKSATEVFSRAKSLNADQLIFRKLYESGEDQDVDQWVRDNAASGMTLSLYEDYVTQTGQPLERLPFGAVRYSVNGISTVVDLNCMPHELTDSFRYLILRPDCKLYSRWDDKGSLVF